MSGVEIQRIALVTGANRGVGFEIARQLARVGCQVYLTARDPARGTKACTKLRRESLDVLFMPLDVTDPLSIEQARTELEAITGRLDVLINNAAVSLDLDIPAQSVEIEVVKSTLETNFFGPLRLCQAFIPLMRRHGYGRIVNISSGRGAFAQLAAGQLGYRVSKTALNALTCILAAELREDNILVNAMTPGWVRTRMGGLRAPRSVEEGADTAAWLATLPDGGPSGKFFKDREEFPW